MVPVILFSLRFPLKNKQTKNRHPEPVEKNMSLTPLLSLFTVHFLFFVVTAYLLHSLPKCNPVRLSVWTLL